MIIKSKVKNLEDFIIENSPEEKEVDQQDTEDKDLNTEIDQILNNLKKLEINLDAPSINSVKEDLQILNEGPAYDKGLEKGQAFGTAAGIAILAIYLKARARKRIEKKKKHYKTYWPAKSKLLIDKNYSDAFFDKEVNREEVIKAQTEKFKEKSQEKIDKVRESNPEKANALKQKHAEKLGKIKELVNKKLDQKKEKRKIDIDRKIEDLDVQWKRDDADTNFASLFSNMSGNPAGGRMQRVWEDWKREFDRKTEDATIKYERDLIDKLYGGEEGDELKVRKGKLAEKIEAFKEKRATKDKEAAEKNAAQDKAEQEYEAKEKESQTDDQIKAKAGELEFNKAMQRFGNAENNALANPDDDTAQTELKKAWGELKMRNNFDGGGSKAAKNLNPDADEKDIETMIQSRKEQMAAFKDAYNKARKDVKKKEPVAQESIIVKSEKMEMVLTEKLHTYNSFMNESRISEYVKRLSKKMKAFFKAVGKESKETKDAVKLVISANKENRKLTDDEKEMVKEQLKDVLKTLGLSYMAIMPGGLLIAVLLKAFELEDKMIPSSFKK